MDFTLDNPFKAALAAGRTQIGLWTSFADPYAIEIVASAGYDWLLIDGEHAPNDVPRILAQLQAVQAYPTHAVVRPPEGSAVLIKQYLDLGAQSLLIPSVETAQQARDLVAATRYPPNGIRGVASARASRWGAIPDYFTRADASVCLLLQIETAKGLDHLDAMLDVDGVHGFFIGPSDLSAALGYLGQPGHPAVIERIRAAIAKIVARGKAAGILCADPALARTYLECGVTFCAVGVDTMLLAQTTRQLARQFKETLPQLPPRAPGATY
ncbi:aldolase/citrate lyase family protein [Pararobbsia silviterrae]|uniref:2-dehydro-3-deoxyglucarate aldolase n=1 Tax=Pararobbsia silviterrae TaxID=1792498 RepID=A0A494Y4R5_9BURK|nr:HpcH/HpaI aldolase/citrate lyase family protein [Pararobbsia silviterrae]RKP57678.1 2-dehydro-3-deoxyglucarate aldolase [Pararobbsia silviterrae]